MYFSGFQTLGVNQPLGVPSLSLPHFPSPFPPSPFPLFPSQSSPLPLPSFRRIIGPLNPARGFGALYAPPAEIELGAF